jgi:8-oxo-dGTP pyrophosphatase MutT (NUDIX family)
MIETMKEEGEKVVVKEQTLAFPVIGEMYPFRVLLGKKLAVGKLGSGLHHGFGGNLVGGESFREAAVRELEEEVGLRAQTEDLIYCGKLLIHERDNLVRIVRVYCLYKWEGVPEETEEMEPLWAGTRHLPLDYMFADTRLWLPKILEGYKICMKIWYSAGMERLESSSLLPLDVKETG